MHLRCLDVEFGVWSLEFGIRVWSLISVCFGKQLYFLVLELGV